MRPRGRDRAPATLPRSAWRAVSKTPTRLSSLGASGEPAACCRGVSSNLAVGGRTRASPRARRSSHAVPAHQRRFLSCARNIGAGKSHQMNRRTHGLRAARGRAWVPAAALAVLLAAPGRAELAPGAVLGAENWQEAKGLLPEEFLDAYRRGDFRPTIGE